jgi:CheY-like chemotaxis protein
MVEHSETGTGGAPTQLLRLAAGDWLVSLTAARRVVSEHIHAIWPDLGSSSSPAVLRDWLGRQSKVFLTDRADHWLKQTLIALADVSAFSLSGGPIASAPFEQWEEWAQSVAASSALAPPRPVRPDRHGREPEAIVCVEDHPDWANVNMRNVFASEFPRTTLHIADSSEQARALITKLAATHQDVLVIIDLRIPNRPGANDDDRKVGMELIEWLRGTDAAATTSDATRRRYQNWPVIVLSMAANSLEDHQLAERYALDAYLPKSYDYEDLVKTIRRVIEHTPYTIDFIEFGRVAINGLMCRLPPREYELLEIMAHEDDPGTPDAWAIDLWHRQTAGEYEGRRVELVHLRYQLAAAGASLREVAFELLRSHAALLADLDLPQEPDQLALVLAERYSPDPRPHGPKAFHDALGEINRSLESEFRQQGKRFDGTRLFGQRRRDDDNTNEDPSAESNDDVDGGVHRDDETAQTRPLEYWLKSRRVVGERGARSPARRFRILVVDDNADFRAQVAETLRQAAYDVRTADFPDALPIDGDWHPDAVCLDLLDQEGGQFEYGVAGIRWLHRHKSAVRHSAIVVLTSVAHEDHLRARLIQDHRIRVRNVVSKLDDDWRAALLRRMYTLYHEQIIGASVPLDEFGYPITLRKTDDRWFVLHPTAGQLDAFTTDKQTAFVDTLARHAFFHVPVEICAQNVYGDKWATKKNALSSLKGSCNDLITTLLGDVGVHGDHFIRSSKVGYSLHARILPEQRS